MSEPDLTAILDDLAAGRIDAAEAARRIEQARTDAAVPPTPPGEEAGQETPDAEEVVEDDRVEEPHREEWRSFAREETRPHVEPAREEAPVEGPPVEEPRVQPDAPSAKAEAPREPAGGKTAPGAGRPAGEKPSSDQGTGTRERPEPTPAGAQGKGAERVSIRSVGRRVRVIGDRGVASVSVSGPHVLRRSGNVLEVTSEGQSTPLEGFSLLRLPRSLDDLKNLGLGTELVVHVNPRLAVDAEVTASGLAIEGVPTLGRIRVSAGGASLKGVRQAGDVLVQMGSALVEGTFAEGRSRVKCESGALTVVLAEGANVTVRGTASMGRIGWPGEGLGAVDEWVVGNGSGRLDVEIVMGMATVKDASADEPGPQSTTGDAAASATGRCPSCGEPVHGGKFCPNCGTPLPSRCAACGASLPPGAKFCPECGSAA